MSLRLTPVDPQALPELLAEHLHTRQPSGIALRVAVDGPPCADPVALADRMIDQLRRLGHDTAVVESATFCRDASLRFEFGREDVDAYPEWTDFAALRREVLDPLGPGGSGAFLPSLRDPVTNRSTREASRTVAAGAVVIVAGEFLLGRGLPFDITVHLAVTPTARARRTRADMQWTLPAHDRYDTTIEPTVAADVVVKLDDVQHPAISI